MGSPSTGFSPPKTVRPMPSSPTLPSGPAIDPVDGQQTGEAACPHAAAVMGKEIPVSLFGLHDAVLVGLVELALRVAELHHDVASVATGFAVEVVVDVADLEELSGLAAGAFVEENTGFGDGVASVGGKCVEPGLVPVPEMRADEVALAVVVPERAAIISTTLGGHAMKRSPRARRVGCRRHEIAFLGSTEVNPEFPVVVSDGAGPDSARVTVHAVLVQIELSRTEAQCVRTALRSQP